MTTWNADRRVARRRQPTDAERDEKVTLDVPLTFEEAARVLVALTPADLPPADEEAEE